jgi:nucleoside-diphosphate-sugar epimerase
MRALVTGATGLVGSYLCERLRADGWDVRALVRDEARARWLAGVELVRGDTTDAASFAAAAAGRDVVFHAAAAITPTGGWEAYRVPNVLGTQAAVDAARGAGARLLHVSSVAVYGGRARYETSGPVSEEHAGAPLADDEHYARSKRESESIVLGAHRRGAVWATAIRPCVVYGRRDRQFVPRIARILRFGVAPLLGGGRAALPLVHAANVADAAVRAATTDAAGGAAFNVANDDTVTFADFVRLAGVGLGRRILTIPTPIAVAVAGLALARLVAGRRDGVATMARASVDFLTRGNPFTSRRAFEVLGWTPLVRHEQGVPEAFAWAREAMQEARDGAPVPGSASPP